MRFLQFDPRNGAAYLRLAEIYEKLGQYDQAIESLHTALRMDLADAGAEFCLNRLLQKRRLEERGLVLCPYCGEEQPPGEPDLRLLGGTVALAGVREGLKLSFRLVWQIGEEPRPPGPAR